MPGSYCRLAARAWFRTILMAQFHLIFCEPDHIIEKSFGRDFRSEPSRLLDLTAGPCSANGREAKNPTSGRRY